MTTLTPAEKAQHRAAFEAARLTAKGFMDMAAKLPGLPDHYRAQAQAIATLCGFKLYHLVGEPTGEDALGYRDDIEALTQRVFDPMLEAIGVECASNFHRVDLELFQGQCFAAVEGNATGNLTTIADDLDNSRGETEADLRRGMREAV